MNSAVICDNLNKLFQLDPCTREFYCTRSSLCADADINVSQNRSSIDICSIHFINQSTLKLHFKRITKGISRIERYIHHVNSGGDPSHVEFVHFLDTLPHKHFGLPVDINYDYKSKSLCLQYDNKKYVWGFTQFGTIVEWVIITQDTPDIVRNMSELCREYNRNKIMSKDAPLKRNGENIVKLWKQDTTAVKQRITDAMEESAIVLIQSLTEECQLDLKFKALDYLLEKLNYK